MNNPYPLKTAEVSFQIVQKLSIAPEEIRRPLVRFLYDSFMRMKKDKRLDEWLAALRKAIEADPFLCSDQDCEWIRLKIKQRADKAR